MPRIAPRLTANARELRTGATDAERALWHILSAYRPRFTRQLPVGPFTVDLACRKAKLAVEIDGSQHADSTTDLKRTQFLEQLRWEVIRFWNSEVADNAEGVAERILEEVAARLGPTHPQPLPACREGRVRRPRYRGVEL